MYEARNITIFMAHVWTGCDCWGSMCSKLEELYILLLLNYELGDTFACQVILKRIDLMEAESRIETNEVRDNVL